MDDFDIQALEMQIKALEKVGAELSFQQVILHDMGAKIDELQFNTEGVVSHFGLACEAAKSISRTDFPVIFSEAATVMNSLYSGLDSSFLAEKVMPLLERCFL